MHNYPDFTYFERRRSQDARKDPQGAKQETGVRTSASSQQMVHAHIPRKASGYANDFILKAKSKMKAQNQN